MPQSSEKIGLALSGGGLRASFFHIGLLAQMAEQGVLKSVAVISTVSGGSIIQARHATSQHYRTPVTNIHSPTQRMGDALVALRPSQLRTKPCSVKTTSNGWTAIRNAILASLARY
ncbi:hypothetical protein BMR04_06060 [Methylococcaceae bacterium HT3]|nr:hypothetical protein BMR04_06060 [Methylococcaceae bacterium HT3]